MVEKTLGIIVPLKSQQNAEDWGVVCQALGRTIRSIDAQTSPAYHALVVGHERPAIFGTRQTTVQFAGVDQPLPDYSGDAVSRQAAITHDKNSKIRAGIKLLSESGARISYWFALDADDLIASKLVELLLSQDLGPGAVLDGGYILAARSGIAVRSRNLSQYCGSTSVLSETVIDRSGSEPDCAWFRYAHMNMHKYFHEELRQQHCTLTQPLVCYVRGHGENASVDYRQGWMGCIKRQVKHILWGRRFETLRSDFGLGECCDRC